MIQWIFLTDRPSCVWTRTEWCILHSFLCLYSFLSVRNISQLPLCVESAESDLGVLHALLSTWLGACSWVGWKTGKETQRFVLVAILCRVSNMKRFLAVAGWTGVMTMLQIAAAVSFVLFLAVKVTRQQVHRGYIYLYVHLISGLSWKHLIKLLSKLWELNLYSAFIFTDPTTE